MRRALAATALLLLSGCRGALPIGSEPTLSVPLAFEGVDETALGPHAASFEVHFESDDPWTYSVDTRLGDGALERSLHIEGVSDARNPGDVRMVAENGVKRMSGPGTADECLRFPESLDVNLSFLGPDDVLPPDGFQEPLVAIAQEAVAGRASTHYAMLQGELDGWQDVQVGLWIDGKTGAVLRYDLAATGWDPFFGAGYGQLQGRYQVETLGPQSIEPIAGCQINYPLPDRLENLVKLPGVVAFETTMTLDETADFFRNGLEADGWEPLQAEERSSGAIVLSYRREGEALDVTIREMDDRTKVELLSD
jgi:hypothetical protein